MLNLCEQNYRIVSRPIWTFSSALSFGWYLLPKGCYCATHITHLIHQFDYLAATYELFHRQNPRQSYIFSFECSCGFQYCSGKFCMLHWLWYKIWSVRTTLSPSSSIFALQGHLYMQPMIFRLPSTCVSCFHHLCKWKHKHSEPTLAITLVKFACFVQSY